METALDEYLFAIVLLILLSRVLGLILKRFGIAELVGYIAAGLILGPLAIAVSGPFGLTWGIRPDIPIEVFADFGILVLMLYTGLTTDFHTFRQVKRASVVVGIAGVAVTFALILTVLLAVGVSFNASLFIAALLSNTAIEVSAGILMKFPESKLKSVVIGASFVDDIVAVLLLGIVSSLIFVGHPDVVAISIIGIKVVAFLLISLFLFAWMLDRAFDRLTRSGEKVLLTGTLLTGLFLALMAREFGLHPVIGAYVAGFVIGRWGSIPDPMLEHSVSRNKLIHELEAPLTAFFAPMFFAYIGLLFVTAGQPDWASLVILVTVLAILSIAGKVIGCGVGARLSGFPARESLVIGLAMGGRGGLELVLLRFGLNSDVITSTEFTAVVAVILITILVAPILFGHSAKGLVGD